ncbi:uncharacterized protein J3D65DRAFT_220479 [Phyllosticta citribraziliensis]|uniref:Transmembrane protein n=1 Tax=Phyllosticta citribraziliensis TaxID=989973 RepID=A0ABR1M5Z5_9PEZI
MRLSIRSSSMLLSIMLVLSTLTMSSSASALAAKEPDPKTSMPKGDKSPYLVCPATERSRYASVIAHSKNYDEVTCRDAPHRDLCDQCVIGLVAAMTACVVACCVNIELGPLIAVCMTGCFGVYEGAVGGCFSR